MPVPLGQNLFDASLRPDGRYLALSNSSDIPIIRVDTRAIVSTPGQDPTGRNNGLVELRLASGGQYNLIISSRTYFQTNVHTTMQIRFSGNSIPIAAPIVHSGDFSPIPGTHFSPDGRRLITQLNSLAHIYDLDDSTSTLTLSGHTDAVSNGVFSPNGRYIATASLDTYTTIWDACSRTLLHSLGPTDDQDTLTPFSPDGKYLLVNTRGGRGSLAVIELWSTSTFSKEATELGPFYVDISQAVFSPGSEYLAFSDYSSFIQIVRLSDLEVVQEWRPRWTYPIEELLWFEQGRKFAFRYLGGLEVYDFHTNRKYMWAAGEYDHYASSGRKVFVLGRG
jgi:WD40 repeat protein